MSPFLWSFRCPFYASAKTEACQGRTPFNSLGNDGDVLGRELWQIVESVAGGGIGFQPVGLQKAEGSMPKAYATRRRRGIVQPYVRRSERDPRESR